MFCFFFRFPQCSESTTAETQSSIQSLLDESKRACEVAAKLREERRNANAEDRNIELLCKICFDAELAILFHPCGHVATCANCCLQLKNCAVCRAPIRYTLRAILT